MKKTWEKHMQQAIPVCPDDICWLLLQRNYITPFAVTWILFFAKQMHFPVNIFIRLMVTWYVTLFSYIVTNRRNAPEIMERFLLNHKFTRVLWELNGSSVRMICVKITLQIRETAVLKFRHIGPCIHKYIFPRRKKETPWNYVPRDCQVT